MTLVEFTTIIRKDVAWRVIIKAVVAIIAGSIAIFSAVIGPVMFVYTLKYGADGVEGVRKDNARLEEQVKGLTRTVGDLQLTVAGVVSEVRTSRSEQSRDLGDIKLMLQQRPARTANVPSRRATQ
jgi:hypothetical protein